MIKQIIHTADWHLEPYKHHDRFKEAIEAFKHSLSKEVKVPKENVRLLITGDLFDNRSKEPSNEAFLLMFNTLKELSEEYKTIITIGNHDYDVNNRSKMDCITPLYQTFTTLGWQNITFLKHTCLHEDENVIFCNYSNFDGNSSPEIGTLPKSGKTLVGLFHDVIQGATNFNSYDFTVNQDHATKTDIFDGCHFVLMGDIHKHQVMKAKMPVAYSGSLYQLNYGESVQGHGYLLWDVEKRSFEFKEVDINFAQYKVEIDSFESAVSGNFKFVN